MGQVHEQDPFPPLIPVSKPDITELERGYVADAMASGWLTSGPYLDRFEREFARWAGYDHCVTCCNGTVALHLALVGMGVGPGDQVIVPTLTYVATAAAVLHAGAVPVFVDVTADGLIDPLLVAKAVTTKTRLIIPVHLMGNRAALEEMPDGIPLLVDAAQGHGLTNGGWSATYSFYANKVITTGEGGAVCTNDPALAERMRWLRSHAMDPLRRYVHLGVGFNYRLTNIQAAIGCAQLERAAEMMLRRRAVHGWYSDRIDVEPAGAVWQVWHRQWDRAVSVPGHVETRPMFQPIHLMEPYEHFDYVGGIEAERLRWGLMLPTSSTMTEQDVEAVCACL